MKKAIFSYKIQLEKHEKWIVQKYHLSDLRKSLQQNYSFCYIIGKVDLQSHQNHYEEL